MWGFIFVVISLVLILYLYFVKKELNRLQKNISLLPEQSSHGSRLYLSFREKSLMDVVDELNKMIDSYEEKSIESKQMEENIKLSITGLSHDLRTPLTSINGYVQLLRTSPDEGKRLQYLSIIEQSVERLIEMTDSFYDLSRIEMNQKQMELTTLSLPTLVEEVLLSFYEQLEDKQIVIAFPSEVVDEQIIADKLMLVRVLHNVTQNLLRYAFKQVCIDYEYVEEFVVFQVKNDIKLESNVAIEKVFTRFYTEDMNRTNTQSSGLGLYLSKRLVEKMNGKMEVEMENDWFILKVYLPIMRKHEIVYNKYITN